MYDYWGAGFFAVSALFFLVPTIHYIIEEPLEYRHYMNMIGSILYLFGSLSYIIFHRNERIAVKEEVNEKGIN